MARSTAATPLIPRDDERGYVKLQTIPYRAHMLLAEAVLRNTSEGDHIFEGGVSAGYFARVLVEHGRRVDGADIDGAAAESARAVCDHVIVGDLQTLEPDDLPRDYDVLLFGDTLEHLPDPPALLRKLKVRLRPGGKLIASVPNVANWSIRLGLMFGRFRYTERGILDRTHLRFYTERTLNEMLNEGGFRISEIKGSVPVPLVSDERLCRYAHRIGNLWPSLFAYSFIVVADPAGDH